MSAFYFLYTLNTTNHLFNLLMNFAAMSYIRVIYDILHIQGRSQGGAKGAMPLPPLVFKIELKRITFPQFFLNFTLFS